MFYSYYWLTMKNMLGHRQCFYIHLGLDPQNQFKAPLDFPGNLSQVPCESQSAASNAAKSWNINWFLFLCVLHNKNKNLEICFTSACRGSKLSVEKAPEASFTQPNWIQTCLPQMSGAAFVIWSTPLAFFQVKYLVIWASLTELSQMIRGGTTRLGVPKSMRSSRESEPQLESMSPFR